MCNLKRSARNGQGLVLAVSPINFNFVPIQATGWTLEPGEDWFEPLWEPIDPGVTGSGTLTDVALVDGLAVAVGLVRIGEIDHGLVLIRRDTGWAPLIAPLEGVRLTAVEVLGERIIAVGIRSRPPDSPEPIAVVSDPSGVGALHRLPTGGVAGAAYDVLATPTHVIAVGALAETADAELGTRASDAALWSLVLGDEPDDDIWAPGLDERSTSDGFQELWSVVEFGGEVYVLGRAEDEIGRRPAAGWTVDLSRIPAADASGA